MDILLCQKPIFQLLLTNAVSWTAGDVLSPDIDVDPTSLSETLQVDETSIQYVTIYNNGDADLIWNADVDYTKSYLPVPVLKPLIRNKRYCRSR